MRLLLDTHVWLWMVSAPERIREQARRALADRDNVVLLSAASAWEIAIKYRLGKLPLPEDPATFIPARLARDRVTPLPVSIEHALHVATLADHHSDPFDRLLVVQAQLEGLLLVTVDAQFDAYDVELLRA